MPERSAPARLFSALVLGGAALSLGCGHDRGTSDAATDAPGPPPTDARAPAPAAETEPDATPTEHVTAVAQTSEPANACECAEQGTIQCQANGVTCCWALDPCCAPCCES